MDKEMKRATGCQAYANTRFLYYINEIRSAYSSCMERKHIPATSEKAPSDI